MASGQVKNTWMTAGIDGGTAITLHGAVSGFDPPEITPASETRQIPNQGDWEETMSTGVTGYDANFTIDLRDGVNDPGSTIPILMGWTGQTIAFTFSPLGYDPAAPSAIKTGALRAVGKFVCSGAAPTADGAVWRISVQGRGTGPLTWSNN